VTPEAFNQQIREMVLCKYPKASISAMLGFHGKSEPHYIEEHEGQPCFVGLGGNIPLLKCGAPRWSFAVFFPEDGHHPFMPRGSIVVHPKTVATKGSEFAETMGKALLKSIAERLGQAVQGGP
jgi:hypothetical protein